MDSMNLTGFIERISYNFTLHNFIIFMLGTLIISIVIGFINKKTFDAPYVISVIVRTLWSLSIGMVFFLIGIILFLMLEILFPETNKGIVILNKMFLWGSLYWFRGIKFQLEQDDYDMVVEKRKK